MWWGEQGGEISDIRAISYDLICDVGTKWWMMNFHILCVRLLDWIILDTRIDSCK